LFINIHSNIYLCVDTYISQGPGDEGEGGEDDMEGRERYDQDVQVNGRGPIYRVTITKVGTIQPNGQAFIYV
jgi:hypothetical protein